MKRAPFPGFLRVAVIVRIAALLALSLLLFPPGRMAVAQAQGLSPNARTVSQQRGLLEQLDSLTRAAISEFPLASVSVAVVHRGNTLFARAYGHAELSFGIPATPETRYRLIGPGTALLAAAVLRAAEQGRLSLSDDASKYLPDFPWQGRRVTIRQLFDATSGLPDYHYLGDAFQRVARTPMRSDEVTALFAGRPFIHEPGAAWSWTISGYHLAGLILERVTGESYPEYLQREVLTPAGLMGIVPCDGTHITPRLARGYTATDGGFGSDVQPTVTAVRFLNSHCGTATAVAAMPDALRRLLRPASYQALITSEGAARSRRDSLNGYALGVGLQNEGGRRWWGIGGNSLLGYGASWLRFREESLSVVVLTNTVANLTSLGRNLARSVLGLPLLPGRAPYAAAPSIPTTAEERQRVLGMYRVEPPLDAPSQFRALRETFCVYEEAGRVMGQYAGGMPLVLLKVDDSTFVGTDRRIGGGRPGLLRFLPGTGRVGAEIDDGGLRKRAVRERASCAPSGP